MSTENTTHTNPKPIIVKPIIAKPIIAKPIASQPITAAPASIDNGFASLGLHPNILKAVEESG